MNEWMMIWNGWMNDGMDWNGWMSDGINEWWDGMAEWMNDEMGWMNDGTSEWMMGGNGVKRMHEWLDVIEWVEWTDGWMNEAKQSSKLTRNSIIKIIAMYWSQNLSAYYCLCIMNCIFII